MTPDTKEFTIRLWNKDIKIDRKWKYYDNADAKKVSRAAIEKLQEDIVGDLIRDLNILRDWVRLTNNLAIPKSAECADILEALKSPFPLSVRKAQTTLNFLINDLTLSRPEFVKSFKLKRVAIDGVFGKETLGMLKLYTQTLLQFKASNVSPPEPIEGSTHAPKGGSNEVKNPATAPATRLAAPDVEAS